MIDNLGIVDTKKIIAAIQESYGLDLSDYTLSILKRRFAHVMDYYNIGLVDEFVNQIKRNNIEYEDFLDQIMIDITEIFRDPSLWRELREKYLPEIAHSAGSKIWLAGESSGDELFSLMVVLSELGISKNIRITASCPSKNRLNRIKKGYGYDLKKMEIGEANYTRLSGKFEFNKFYKMDGSFALMNPELLDNVEFDTTNISQEKVNKSYRMILFRNMMIQYNLPLYEKVARKLIDNLVVGGYLILGNMESLEYSEIGKKMQLVNEAEKIYRKRID
ncbi:MAG: CheR family methyltransferase [Salinivirgaceae bacterium]